MRIIKQLALVALVCLAFAVPANAALIDIVVIGTWTGHNTDPADNPFGILTGDKFVMKATYDDTSLFFRADAFSGVVASLDPTINPGVSLDVIVPHTNANGTGPEPLTFTEADHNSIGFAPTAEIHFDGPSVASPGNFRNFEFHFDFQHFNTHTGVNQDFDMDQFFGSVTEQTDIFNITEAGSKAATAFPSSTNGNQPTLVVTTNDTGVSAPDLVFNSGNFNGLGANATATGGNGFGFNFVWSLGGSPVSTLEDPTFSILDLGLVNTVDTATLTLESTELYTDFAANDTVEVSYANTAPIITSASATENPNGSWTFALTADDVDLAANALVAGFEAIQTAFTDSLGNPFLVGTGGTVSKIDLLNFFGGPGTYTVFAGVQDLAGAIGFQPLFITIPEPAVAALLVMAGLATARRRHA